MLNNQQFIDIIRKSFKTYLTIDSSRSTAKLKILHGSIAKDIKELFGAGYTVLSQGIGNDYEGSIQGRYYPKNVDITVSKNGKPIAGYAIKFVMRNYSQNSNNYFENMLGETANIRTANCPYFQIFIILDKLPYYKNSGELAKWEEFTDHNITKYCRLSYDDVDNFFHTPNKTLIYVVHTMPEVNEYEVFTKTEYLEHYRKNVPTMSLSRHRYPSIAPDGAVILNDYEKFINKVYHTIMAR